ncbi:MAG TPA: glycosyltransferase [Myxococcota bacterium]|nr:glycosyltransferase [Myxococcota bacterium]
MKLSVVVVVYNMQRAAPRTLGSLASSYQRGVRDEDYEVIVVENGSSRPLDADAVRALGENFRYFFLEGASPSPAPAVNFGASQARGESIGVLIDGARIVTPNLLRLALRALEAHPRGVVCSTGWTLGRHPQNWAVARGFDEAQEDALLEEIDWPREPYRLFEISTLDGSSSFLGPIAETNTLFLRRALWDELGGMDEAFDQPGGGFVNLDTLERGLALPGAEMVLLLGEASFHQIHGGVSTNSLPHQLASDLERWHVHYQNLRQQEWRLPKPRVTYYGTMPEAYRLQLRQWATRESLGQLEFLRDQLAELQAQAERANALADGALRRVAELERGAARAAAPLAAPVPARRAEGAPVSLAEELADTRAALQAARAELHDVRSSLAFRAGHAASRRLKALAPPGSRRGRASLRARALLRWGFRWRLGFASRPARQELADAWRALRAGRAAAPELQQVVPFDGEEVFAIEEWQETPLLHEADVETLMASLWKSSERSRGPGVA